MKARNELGLDAETSGASPDEKLVPRTLVLLVMVNGEQADAKPGDSAQTTYRPGARLVGTAKVARATPGAACASTRSDSSAPMGPIAARTGGAPSAVPEVGHAPTSAVARATKMPSNVMSTTVPIGALHTVAWTMAPGPPDPRSRIRISWISKPFSVVVVEPSVVVEVFPGVVDGVTVDVVGQLSKGYEQLLV